MVNIIQSTVTILPFPAPINLTATAVSDSKINLSWDVSPDAVAYKLYRDDVFIATAVTNSYPDTGLTANTTYTYKVSAVNEFGGYSEQSDPASATTLGGVVPPPGDRIPPVISNVRAINITDISAVITWDTNENATSIVEYGLTTSYEIGSGSSGELVLSHSIPLSGLTPDTEYHFHVLSRDGAGNLAASGDYVFRTLKLPTAFMNLRAVPEKRLPKTGNNSTILRVRVFESGTDNLLADKTVTTDLNGYGSSIELEGLTAPQVCDFLLKGYSHLDYRKNNITVDSAGTLIDFSEDYTKFLKAGDVNGASGDNYVNGLDLSVLANHIYSDDYRSDLNQDQIVNGLEFGIAVTNLYKWGDF
ncbi:fibronectin type III domain-containing protein [Patescibacteria group bacterium]|nr:fibronectin type III domain-containing protein [Patescibacteria group bacterium]